MRRPVRAPTRLAANPNASPTRTCVGEQFRYAAIPDAAKPPPLPSDWLVCARNAGSSPASASAASTALPPSPIQSAAPSAALRPRTRPAKSGPSSATG